MAERDPRVDPRARDVLRRNSRTRFILDHIPDDWVVFETPTGRRQGYITQERPDVFRIWAATATVVRQAQDRDRDLDILREELRCTSNDRDFWRSQSREHNRTVISILDERDEWKARAEKAETERRRHAERKNPTVRPGG